MNTFSVEIQNQKLLDDYADLFEQAPQLMSVIAAKVGDKYGDVIQAIVSAEPGPPRYPILWTSRRQEVAFYASHGFGRGIPTPRTHDTARRSKVVVTSATASAPASIGVEEPTAYDRFVRGWGQQEFHRRTGWIKLDDRLSAVQNDMVNEFGDLTEQAFRVVGAR